MLRVDMLPAAHGDCLWIEWPDGATTRRILIDGGPRGTYHHLYDRIAALGTDDRHFELLIITHIDADHIEGILRLLREETLGVTFGDVWFNGWDQIEDIDDEHDPDYLNVNHGQMLTALLTKLEGDGALTWNAAFDRKAAMYRDGAAPIALAGGVNIHVVGPIKERLVDLREHWHKVLNKAGKGKDTATWLSEVYNTKRYRGLSDAAPPDQSTSMKPEQPDGEHDPNYMGFVAPPPDPDAVPYVPTPDITGDNMTADTDDSTANASSIAIVLTLGAKAILLAGDAYADDLVHTLSTLDLPRTAGRLDLDAFKLPHHGSIRNLSAQLVEAIQCRDFLVSTNGNSFNHPHRQALELIVDARPNRGAPRFHFNYRTDDSEVATARLEGKAELHYPTGTSMSI